ncbi:MlaD family protein [Neptunomonas antarctica]|uniref:Phospholipid/cholesterol/gamma-HCH transport system substrate-binding protein n=1 Tax=Neptunomonas antarctica TaxID=619304 RepID=A0A1N7P540_9GAMM|nr:MlaD family protein [Neptunomonas antarctica]SIT05694.1 phospholipid/cholesterol/gamma-HCH transport system substrate-binding protein [Neptunomonas antarctica]
MESKINYTLVGLFVVVLSLGLMTFAFWLGKYGGQEEYDYYYIYMTESVAGLSTDSSVKYRGVDIGTVDNIALNPENSEQVALLLRVQHLTPVKVDTTATMKSFGLTGLVYVELEGGRRDSELLIAKEGEIPIIPARPSAFVRFSESMNQLTEQTDQALEKFSRLLSEENIHNISVILYETRDLSIEVGENLQGLKKVIEGGIVTEERVIGALKHVESASLSIKNMADSLRKSSVEVSHNIGEDVHKSLESFNQLIYQLDILAVDLQRTTQSIENTPGDLLFKRSTPKPGPGEEGYSEK